MEYKIKLYIHKSVRATIDDDIVKCSQYFLAHGVKLFIDIEHTNISKDEALMKLMQPLDGKMDCVMYLYNRGVFNNQGYNGITFKVSKTLRGIYMATDVLDDSVDYTWKSMSHEIMHSLFMKLIPFGNGNIPLDTMLVNGVWKNYYKNEELDAPDGNFAEAWRLLVPYINKKYQYFSQKELDKFQLKPELWQILDDSRALSGVPFIITSGLRTVEQNTAVGGKPNSAHLRGLAVDILCDDNFKRTGMLRGILGCGRSVFIEVAQKHLHIDIDSSIHQLGQTMLELNDD